MAIEWNKVIEEAKNYKAPENSEGKEPLPFINLDDEWRIIELKLDWHLVKDVNTKFGAKTKHFMRTVPGNAISFTEAQWRILVDWIPKDAKETDTLKLEMKIGIDNNTKHQVLKVREA